MRRIILTLCLVTPAHAWEFTPGVPCVLTHETPQAQIELTYDPTGPLYSITVTLPQPWPDSPAFGMQFFGPQGRVIGTDRHQLSNEGRSLTVTDKGFGNVLDGLQFNHTAIAASGDVEVRLPLEGASKPVADFRSCTGLGLTS